jgi:multicomponent K+:H+ antiporter subunit E
MTALERLLPAPLTSASLFAIWLVLARDVTAAQIGLGLALGLGVPIFTSRLRPSRVKVRRPLVVARFILTVGYDVLRSNFDIAWDVVRWRWRKPRSRFVIVPLELRDPLGLAALSMVTTVVPGTVWSELALDRSALLLHVWNVDSKGTEDGDHPARTEAPVHTAATGAAGQARDAGPAERAFVARFKARYEKPLREIFE